MEFFAPFFVVLAITEIIAVFRGPSSSDSAERADELAGGRPA